jgi:hypothetical protein
MFCFVVLSGSAFAGIFGGWGGFRWMLLHGASGPLVMQTLYWSPLDVEAVLSTAVAASAVFAFVQRGKGWNLAWSLLVAIAWPLLGWSAGI